MFTKKETVYATKNITSRDAERKKDLLFEDRVCTNLAMKLKNKQRAEIYLSGYKTKFNSPENYGKSNAHQWTKNISNYSKAAEVRAE